MKGFQPDELELNVTDRVQEQSILGIRWGTASRLCMTVIALTGWLALLLQFYLLIIANPPAGASLIERVIRYFSFFTILTNTLIAIGLSCSLWTPDSRWGRFFSRDTVKASFAVYIGMVGVVYLLLLRQLWNPQGTQKLADTLLHEAIPVMYVAYWLIFAPRSSLRWKNATLWLIYPLTYLFYTLARGAVSGWYPYPFIDVNTLGYSRVFLNVVLFSGAFWGVGLIAIAISRWRARNKPDSKVQHLIS